MTKPICEQEFHAHPLDSRIILDGEERVVADIREPLSEQGREVGLLFAAAPDMARALLGDMVRWEDGLMHDEFRCPILAGGECAEWCAAKRAALRKAKVLP